jgi:hypothetical protein
LFPKFLFSTNQEFAVTANIKGVEFSPNLPHSIMSKMSQYSLFALANYTFESASIDDEYLYFEAGFGQENFASEVRISLYAIFQIIVDESILFVNPIATVQKYFEQYKSNQRSVNAFLSNKNNNKLFQ